MSKGKIRIGTRKSTLALWQANYIAAELTKRGADIEIVPVTSTGDQNLSQPLYEIGVQGIFTKTLDVALLNNRIDIAVHSLKDVPTALPQGLKLSATPQRGNHIDSLVYKTANIEREFASKEITIATSSLRRKAQWLHRYPHHKVVSVRGNINTRLSKLMENKDWDGIIFASAGIERIQLKVPHLQTLDWMLPAPGQGALALVCREDDIKTKAYCTQLNHIETMKATGMERMFLRHLQGGCTMPIAAYAYSQGNKFILEGNVYSLDGVRKANVTHECNATDTEIAGKQAAISLLQNGGAEIIKEFTQN